MKRILFTLLFCLSTVLVGCGESQQIDLSGTWNSENGLSRYILTAKDDGYKVLHQRKVSNGSMVDGRGMFFKKEGSYLALDGDRHFIEIINGNELKLTSTGMIYKKNI